MFYKKIQCISLTFIGVDHHSIRRQLGERERRQRELPLDCLLRSYNIFICNSTVREQQTFSIPH